MPLAPPVMVRPVSVMRCAPEMVMAFLPPPLIEVAPRATSCRPLVLMLTGPEQVPLMFRMVLGKANAAALARDSPRVQSTVMLNCANAGVARLRVDRETAKARKGLRWFCMMGLLTWGINEGPLPRRHAWCAKVISAHGQLSREWADENISPPIYTRHFWMNSFMRSKIFYARRSWIRFCVDY